MFRNYEIFGNLDDMLKNSYGFHTSWKDEIKCVVTHDEKFEQLELPLPGYDKDDIDVRIEREFLFVESKIPNKWCGNKHWSKKFKLTSNADLAGITSSLDKGVLTITVPLLSVAKMSSRTIKIQ